MGNLFSVDISIWQHVPSATGDKGQRVPSFEKAGECADDVNYDFHMSYILRTSAIQPIHVCIRALYEII